MSSRIARRAFAPAFVVTVAATTASVTTSGAETAPNPPPPKKREPAKVEQRWHVFRRAADPKATPPRAEQCFAEPHVDCPKPEAGKPVRTCNPPAPIPYACPATVKDTTFAVVLAVGATECRVVDPPVKCAPGEKCNPPAPRAVPCPS